MKKTMLVLSATLVGLALMPAASGAHCQVPCGIYDDAARVASFYEDAATIEKAMVQIGELAARTDALSANQLARWVATKELHASKIITVVSEYFLTQKVKPVAAGAEGHDSYLESLAAHHAVMVLAMKCKQNVDVQSVAQLRGAIAGLAGYYETTHAH